MFMSSVVLASADDIPQGDKDALIAGVTCFGGQYSDRLTKLCTHIVALSADNDMCRLVEEKSLPIKIVLPHWFDDCLKLGRLIAPDPYTLPDPKILRPDCQASNIQIYSSQDIDGATSLSPDPPNPGIQQICTVFRGRVIKLEEALHISDHLRSTLDSIIVAGGGSVTKLTRDADILVCQLRSGKDYKAASRAGIDVGNLTWLYYLINWNKWTSPTRRLLHYPLPKGGIAKFSTFRISLSNYSGEARVYLENLIRAAGGTYTRNLAQDNTHLITAHSKSDKVEAAREWNLSIVNHLWLEESYARCEVQSVTLAAYTTFPPGTNLTQVVGQTAIDRDAVRACYYAEDPLKTDNVTKNLQDMGLDGSEPAAQPLSNQKNQTPPESRGAKSRALNKLHNMAPDIAAYEKESKRVGGVIYGGRRVNDPDRIVLKTTPGRKRPRGEDDSEDDGTPTPKADDAAIKPVSKKKKKKKIDTTEPRRNILTTSLGDTLSEEDIRRLNEVAGSRVLPEIPRGNIASVDILVAPAIKRTTKFFAGIAAGAEILGPSFVKSALKKGKLDLSPSFRLKDPAMEKENSFTLQDALKRARQHKTRGGMLKGWTIFCTEHVKGGADMMKEIIELNGGGMILYKGRRTLAPALTRRLRAKIEKPASATTSDNQADNEEINAGANQNGDDGESAATRSVAGTAGQNRLFCLTVKQDTKLWDPFCAIARDGSYVPCLVKTEWLLRIAMTQNLNAWQDDWEWPNNAEDSGAVTPKRAGSKRA